MTVIVNTDYESVLFENKPSLKMVRELEFLALWLEDQVQNTQNYSEEYLAHIEKLRGKRPKLVGKNLHAKNWWGALENLQIERLLNSKKTSLELSYSFGENVGSVLYHESELAKLDPHQTYLFKSFSGVSGRGHKFSSQLKPQDFPLIAEVFHQRKIDFSTYCFSNGDKIYYQNFISPQFGYKGSLFDLENVHSLKDLSFTKQLSHLAWDDYLFHVETIYQFVRNKGDGGFSIDSYVFDNSIRSLCEINYRRTMGMTAYEIARNISQKRFQLFLIFKTDLEHHILNSITNQLEAVLLSHEKNIFSYLLLSADQLSYLQKQIDELESIIGTSFAIKIE